MSNSQQHLAEVGLFQRVVGQAGFVELFLHHLNSVHLLLKVANLVSLGLNEGCQVLQLSLQGLVSSLVAVWHS
jgi:hypothetical protein